MPDPGVVGEADEFLDEPLAAVVGGVGLAGDDELHGPLGVEQQRPQPVLVAQHQGEPLVRGDAAGEADGEDVGVEDGVGPAEFGGGRAALPPGGPQPVPYVGDEPFAQGAAQVPQLAVARVGAERADLGGDPGGGVDAVGDGGDGHFFGVESRPESGEHGAADGAVQGGDAVGALGEAQAHGGHVEDAGFAAEGGLVAEGEDAAGVDAGQGAVLAEVAGDQGAVEAVDAGRDGGVGGEDGPGPDGLQGAVEVEPVALEFPDAFEAEEAGVALVGVEDLGGGVAGEPGVRADGADAADAEQHLLEEPVLAAAAVEAVGDAAFAGGVLLDVGVEHEQRDAADLGGPQVGVQAAAAGQGEGDAGGGAVGLAEQGDGQLAGVEDGVLLLLPAVPAEGLAEVAVPVEQSDADQGDAEVAGGLEVVAGEDAEAAGVLGQGGGHAELGREVGDGGREVAGLLLVPAGGVQIGVEVLGGGAEPDQEVLVGGERGEPGGFEGAEDPDGVGAGRGVRPGGAEGLEEGPGGLVPGPAQVARQVSEGSKGVGEDGTHGESTDCLHVFHLRRRVRTGGDAPRCVSGVPLRW